jgi:hypothetical protein
MPVRQARAEQEREQLGKRARMQPAESWTGAGAEPAGPRPLDARRAGSWTAEPARGKVCSPSLLSRCAGCQRSIRELQSGAWKWHLVPEPRPVAAAVAPEPEPELRSASACLGVGRRTSRSSLEWSSEPAGLGRGSMMVARPASCAPSAGPAARCRSPREPSPPHERRRPAREPAHPKLNPWCLRPLATTTLRTSGPPEPVRQAARREPRQGLLGPSEPMRGSTSASALPASDLCRQHARPEDRSVTNPAGSASSAAPVKELPLRPCQ